MWHITIDKIAESGKTQRHESEERYADLATAIEYALVRHRLPYVEVGQFQITATSMEHDRA